MGKITINKTTCIKCGICSEVCPVSIIVKDADSWPCTDALRCSLCINCGHCEAHCPHKALSLSYDYVIDPVPDFHPPLISEHELELYLKNRRSVRSFKPMPANKRNVERAMDMVRYAPSSKNFQHVKWTIIHDSAQLSKILDAYYVWMKSLLDTDTPLKKMLPVEAAIKLRERGNEIILRGAPHIAIAHVSESGPMGPAAVYDTIIALSHFDIVLPAFHLGGFWAGFFTMGLRNSAELRKLCIIPEGNAVGYAYCFGVPKYDRYAIPKRKKADIAWL